MDLNRAGNLNLNALAEIRVSTSGHLDDREIRVLEEPEGGEDARVLDGETGDLGEEIRVCEGGDVGEAENVAVDVGREMESRVCFTSDQAVGSTEARVCFTFDSRIAGVEDSGSLATRGDSTIGVRVMEEGDDGEEKAANSVSMVVDTNGEHDNSRYSPRKRVDGSVGFESEERSIVPYELLDTVSGDMDGVTTSDSVKILGSKFEMGDMVWAKVKSHPWWPGHVFSEAFVSPSVRLTRRDGHILVAFFGDSSYGWFHPAELIPYDPHYAGKSQQTTSRNFMRAVEDSVDEASRRAALGLSCRCRNPCTFRRTKVRGHFAVDVFDYDPAGIYSMKQIQEARDRFQTGVALSFIKQLALVPSDAECKSLDFVKNKATAIAYRRAVFEEFDETYAQAFGQKPVRPAHLPSGATNQPFKEPARALLSGRLVIAEALGGRKSSTKAAKLKERSKEDRSLFKWRDEPSNSRSLLISHGPSPSSSHEQGALVSPASGCVFQKREEAEVETPSLVTGAKASPAGLSGMVDPNKSGKTVDPGPGEVRDRPSYTSADANHSGAFSDLIKKKKTTVKRTVEEGSSEMPSSREKKIKKQRKKNAEVHCDDVEKKPLLVEDHPKKLVEASDSGTDQAGLVLSGVIKMYEAELAQLLSDLRALSLNLFHGIEHNRPAIVCEFFLRFRSLVFQKRLSASFTPSEPESPHESPAIRSSAATFSESKKNMPSSKPPRSSAKPDDPTETKQKWVPSERQEEIAAKRAKKVVEAKRMAAEKKAILKKPEIHQTDGMGKETAPPPRTAARTDEKVEPPPRVEELTIVNMRYPPGSSLPSLVELKARFARFGPLDTSRSRVFYQTNTCRVVFLYKEDAQTAYRYYVVGKNSVFTNVRFTLRPVAPPLPPALVRPKAADSPMEQQQLKSCLKKPSGDEAGGSPNGSNRGARVRFDGVGEDTGDGGGSSGSANRGLQVQMTGVENENHLKEAGPRPLLSSSSSVVMDDDVSNNQRLISSSNPLPSQPPITKLNYNLATAAPPSQQPALEPGIDISEQMLSLMTRCHDVVTNVKSTIGYKPYCLL